MNYTVQLSSPGIKNIMDSVKAGQAKLVTAYPVAGSWNNAGAYTKYSDTPDPAMAFTDEYGQVSHGESQNLLYMNGKLYLPTNDWGVIPVTKQVDNGDYSYSVPTGQFRIRERASGNVFNDFYIAADGSGQVTGYSPTLSQSGSNSGWGGGFVGNMLGGIQDLVTSSPVVPMALAVALPGAGTAIGTALGLEGAVATVAGNTIIQSALNGGDVEKALVNSVIGTAANAAGAATNTAVDEAAAAAKYGTDIGSQQTSVLAAQEAGMGTAGDLAGNVAGKAVSGLTSATLSGKPVDATTLAENALKQTALSEGKALSKGDLGYNLDSNAGSLGSESDLPSQLVPADDGTTTDIQEIIDTLNKPTTPTETNTQTKTDTTTQAPTETQTEASSKPEEPAPAFTEKPLVEEPQCPFGWHWDGSVCVANTDTGEAETTCPDGYIFDLTTHSCVPVGTTTTTKETTGTTTPKLPSVPTTPTTPPTTPKTPTTPTTPTAPQTTNTSVTTPSVNTTNQSNVDVNTILSLLGGFNKAPTPTPLFELGTQFDMSGDYRTNPFLKQRDKVEAAEGGSIDDLLAILMKKY